MHSKKRVIRKKLLFLALRGFNRGSKLNLKLSYLRIRRNKFGKREGEERGDPNKLEPQKLHF